MFTIGDIYWTEFLAFIIGCCVTAAYFLSRKPKRDSRGRFTK